MSLDDQAEQLAIRLEQDYLEGGLPRLIGTLLLILKALQR